LLPSGDTLQRPRGSSCRYVALCDPPAKQSGNHNVRSQDNASLGLRLPEQHRSKGVDSLLPGESPNQPGVNLKRVAASVCPAGVVPFPAGGGERFFLREHVDGTVIKDVRKQKPRTMPGLSGRKFRSDQYLATTGAGAPK
jgi:hypothetical protein